MSSRLVVRKRITGLFLGMAFFLFMVILRLVWVQVVSGDELSQKAEDYRLRSIQVEAKRGTIYDRNMKPLAVSISADTIYANPSQVRASKKTPEIAQQLAQILKMDEKKVLDIITRNSGFEYVKRKVTPEEADQVRKLKLPGIAMVEESRRYYPKNRLASHVLGFAGTDNQGLEGIEVTYDKELGGKAGMVLVEYDSLNREMPQATHRFVPPEDGNSLVLTIDETIQYFVERELDKVMRERNPKGATIIAMEPKTGRILAMASRPDYDPNDFGSFPQENWRNFAISKSYEPGSTFKIVTAAAALDEGVVKPDDQFFDPGFIKVGSDNVNCWLHGGHGSQTFAQVVENSCNPGFVSVGMRLGMPKFFNYLYGFGFGDVTGIDLPGEASGILVNKNNAKPIDLATMSIGQANAVTPIQLVTAAAAIANGGKLMQPQIVQEIRTAKGELVKEIKPKVVREIISEGTDRLLRDLLEGVVANGTGKNAYIEGYRVAGKTGTAQKIAPGGGYSSNEYVASFVGFAPANDPQIAMLVVVDAPQGYPYYGGQVAAPIFKAVMQDALRYLGVTPQYSPKDLANKPQKPEEVTGVPDVTGKTQEEAEKALRAAGLTAVVDGAGPVVRDQTPKGSAQVKTGTTVLLYLGPLPGAEDAPVSTSGRATGIVPDVRGKPMREAGEVLAAAGLKFSPSGSGLAVKQSYGPGTKVPLGTVIQVEFLPPEETIGP